MPWEKEEAHREICTCEICMFKWDTPAYKLKTNSSPFFFSRETKRGANDGGITRSV